MKRKLLILDFGHSWLTFGKRTPFFLDGSFMHEWEFNNAVGMKLYKELLNSNIDVFITSTYKFNDISLLERTNRANREILKYGKENCLLVSLHANAFQDNWNEAGGMSTFSYPNNEEDYKINQLFNTEMAKTMKKYKIRNRGAKQENFHIIREVICPAILIEHAFMTNKREAKLLLKDKFRTDCAKTLCNTVLKYFNLSGEVSYEKYVNSFGFRVDYLWGNISDFGVKVLKNGYGQNNKTIEEENCTNGTFFSYQEDGKYFSTSILYHDGIIYQDVANHYREQGKSQSCLIIYKNGNVEMKKIKTLHYVDLENIKTIFGGLGLLDTTNKDFVYNPKAEGFCKCFVNRKWKNYADVLRNTSKTVIGWRKDEPDKIYLMTFAKATHYRLLKTLKAKSFPFDIAISVDGGGSTFMNNDDSIVYCGDGRKIHNIIGFNL